jgi:hypothetical protein
MTDITVSPLPAGLPFGIRIGRVTCETPADPATRRGRFERWPLIAPMVLDFLKD